MVIDYAENTVDDEHYHNGYFFFHINFTCERVLCFIQLLPHISIATVIDYDPNHSYCIAVCDKIWLMLYYRF